MANPTPIQQKVLQFFQAAERGGRVAPTQREVATHFGFKSKRAAAYHIEALKRMGLLSSERGKARSLQVTSPLARLRRPTADIPLFGSIPAGFGEDREQEAEGCVSVDIQTIGFKPTRNTFALRVSGDSMIGRQICDGDVVILEHGRDPRNGQIVAALIDRKSTLKTFVIQGAKSFLKAENPKYPNLIPSEELMIQGVFRGLIRKARE